MASCAVEDALETAKTTLVECQNTMKRLCADPSAPSLLPKLHEALTIIHDRLEFVLDDEELFERLESIIIGNADKSCKFLVGLDVDLQSIQAYLQTVGQGPAHELLKEEVDMYDKALRQYSQIIKLANKRNFKYVLIVSIHESLGLIYPLAQRHR
jgi:hypothetical protein